MPNRPFCFSVDSVLKAGNYHLGKGIASGLGGIKRDGEIFYVPIYYASLLKNE